MTNYHVGCGEFGIYAGTLNKKGYVWRNKSVVTHEALCAVAQYLLFNDIKFHFKIKGKWYVMQIKEWEKKKDETN